MVCFAHTQNRLDVQVIASRECSKTTLDIVEDHVIAKSNAHYKSGLTAASSMAATTQEQHGSCVEVLSTKTSTGQTSNMVVANSWRC